MPKIELKTGDQFIETTILDLELAKLFGTYFIKPTSSIEDAFIVANRIARIIDSTPAIETRIGMLNLCQTGLFGTPDGNNWAASFDVDCTDHSEWYESRNPGNLRYMARAPTPHLAIARAAAKCVPLLVPFLKQ